MELQQLLEWVSAMNEKVNGRFNITIQLDKFEIVLDLCRFGEKHKAKTLTHHYTDGEFSAQILADWKLEAEKWLNKNSAFQPI